MSKNNERTAKNGLYGTYGIFTLLTTAMALMGAGYGLIILADAIPNFWIKGFLALSGIVLHAFTLILTWHILKIIYQALTEDEKGTRDGSGKVG